MDFNAILPKFKEYLLKNNENLTENELNSKFIVFKYADEFKTYIENEGFDVAGFDLNLNQLEDLKFEDGKISSSLQSPEQDQTDEKEEDISFILDFLNEILEDDLAKTFIDKNGDNIIDESEIKDFLNEISVEDENSSNISFEDVSKYVHKNIFSDSVNSGDSSKVDETEDSLASTLDIDTTHSTTGGGGIDYIPNTSSNKSNSNNTTTSLNKEENLSSLSIEQLNVKKDEKITEISSAQTELNSFQNGTNPELQTLNQELDQAQAEYLSALESDTNISDDLKTELNNSYALIESNKTKISAKQIEISSKQFEIYQNNLLISQIDSAILTISGYISDLNSRLTDEIDPDKQAQIQENILILQAKLDQKNAELTEIQSKNNVIISECDNLILELDDLNSQNVTLEARCVELENEINNKACDNTKALFALYQDKKTKLETFKNEKISALNKKIDTLKVELKVINDEIINKQNVEYKSDSLISDELFTKTEMNFTRLKDNETALEYLLIAPKEIDENEKLPMIVYLHGAGAYYKPEENGLPYGILHNKLETNPNAYILCPLTTGTWDSDEIANKVNTLVQNFANENNVDQANISLTGHSIGGRGVLNIARHSDSNIYARIASVSPASLKDYDDTGINVPILYYSATRNNESNCYDTAQKLSNGSNYISLGNIRHGRTAIVAAGELDSDNNGRSDYFEWLLGLTN